MREPRPLEFRRFDRDTFRQEFSGHQGWYIANYLSDLGAQTIVEEPYYFDRDYLSEFSAFYGASAVGYPNVCRRLHFFDHEFNREMFLSRLGAGLSDLQASYLGFAVVRPLHTAEFGRTVLRWYADDQQDDRGGIRVTTPSREYECHLAGARLTIEGLAWQQQDSAVGACATVGLWSLLHSSAFDDHHRIPTTAEVTRAANRSLGARVIPSRGLTVEQIVLGIRELGLVPDVYEGDVTDTNGFAVGFSLERFTTTCCSFLRSGYPVLLGGRLEDGALSLDGRHAVVLTGYRACGPRGGMILHDIDVPFVYLHDDNIGPNVRCSVEQGSPISLKLSRPPTQDGEPDDPVEYSRFIPESMLLALPDDLRTSLDTLHRRAVEIAYSFQAVVGDTERPSVNLSTRYFKLHEYVGDELGQRVSDADRLAGLRLALSERIRPMSLHIGAVRIGLGSKPLFDVLYDTSDSDVAHPAFCCVLYEEEFAFHLEVVSASLSLGLCLSGID